MQSLKANHTRLDLLSAYKTAAATTEGRQLRKVTSAIDSSIRAHAWPTTSSADFESRKFDPSLSRYSFRQRNVEIVAVSLPRTCLRFHSIFTTAEALQSAYMPYSHTNSATQHSKET